MVKSPGERGELFEVSLSTMWAQRRFKHMAEFVEKAKEFGFSQVEAHSSLSHKMQSAHRMGCQCQVFP